MQRVHVWVSGRVQGVGFRAHVDYKARQIGVQGWVRNTGQAGVEAVAEGDLEKLALFVEAIKQGPAGARVMESRVEWESATGEFATFAVRPSA
jgi:acylphosphatase